MKKLGYREMLRDRCPKLVSHALKWQKAKEKWIDHTYEKFVKIVGDEYSFSDKLIRKAPESKKVIMRALLGIVNGKVRHFDFDKTIGNEYRHGSNGSARIMRTLKVRMITLKK